MDDLNRAKIDGPRGTRPEEFDAVLDMVNWVFRESRGRRPTMGEAYPLLFHPDNLDNLRAIFVDDRPVSHIGMVQRDAVVLGCRIRIGSVGSVGTHPDHRERGYATRLLGDCVEKLRRDGSDVMLVSGGRGLYRRNGCAPAGRAWTFTVPRADASRFGGTEVQILPNDEVHLPGVIALYQREPIRFLRSVEDFRALFGAADVLTRLGIMERRIFRCLRNGDTLAYAVVTLRSEEGPRNGVVTEYAGNRRMLLEAMPLFFDALSLDALTFTVLPSDLDMRRLLRGDDLEPVPGHIGGHTLRVVDFPRMMDKFRPYFAERVGRAVGEALVFSEEGERRVFELGSERVIVNGEDDLGRILFDTGLPGGDASGRTGAALRELLPLPFVMPGLNFV